jgi:hypothetical protein
MDIKVGINYFCVWGFFSLKLKTKNYKTCFILYAPDSPPLNSGVKIETSYEVLFYVKFDNIN